MVKVLYFGNIRAAVGKGEETLAPALDTTPYQLLLTLAERNGAAFRDEIFREGLVGLRDDLMITINGAVIGADKAADIQLRPNDELALYPIFPGGG
ncbi:MAG: MoaD/ThiS family protein [Clostridiales bacterium]|nr:MoaD/ThiS family protein [Clostridiales bacterium]